MMFDVSARAVLRWLTVVSMVMVLAGCDGGGDKGGTAASSPSASAVSASQEQGPVATSGANGEGAVVPASGGYPLRIGYIGPAKGVGGAIGWALEKGILAGDLKAAGVTAVTQHIFPNGPDLNEALLGGSLDIGVYGDTPALAARSNDGATRFLGFGNVAIDAWLVGPPNGAAALAELAGQRVGVPRGSYLHRYLAGLQEQGLLKDIQVVYLYPRDAQPALERGDIAAYAAPVGLGPQLKARGFKVIDQASWHGLQGNSVIVAREAFLKERPGFAALFDRLREQGAHDLLANPDAYYSYYLGLTGFDDQVVRESYPLAVFNVEAFPPKGLALLEGTKTFLLSSGLAKNDFSIADWQWLGNGGDVGGGQTAAR